METLTEKAEMLKKYLKYTNSSLVICANIGPNMATFKFFKPQEEDSLKLNYTFSNSFVDLFCCVIIRTLSISLAQNMLDC